VIALSIRESSSPLFDLTRNDGEGGPSGTVKEELVDKRTDPREHFDSYGHCSRH
jgi:hypothetical protein